MMGFYRLIGRIRATGEYVLGNSQNRMEVFSRPIACLLFFVVIGFLLTCPLGAQEGDPETDDSISSPSAQGNDSKSVLKQMLGGEVFTLPLEDAEVKSGDEGERVRIRSLSGFLNLIEENRRIFASARTEIEYRGYKVAADQIMMDLRSGRVEAAGNVILQGDDGAVYADSVYYNFFEHEGKAYKASGSYAPLYFSHDKKETRENPSFQVLSKDEVLLQGASLTTCDLAVPHYRLSAKEIIIFMKERVFIKGAVLRIWEVPVFYLPVYSRSLREPSPWYFWMGFHSKLGMWIRQGYTFKHETETPSVENDNKYRNQSQGILTAYYHHYFQRGPGGGMEYRYQFDYNRHEGAFDLFFMDDYKRDVHSREKFSSHYRLYDRESERYVNAKKYMQESHEYEPQEDLRRYKIGLDHVSRITDRLKWMANVDYISDADLYREILDSVSEIQRKRVTERRIRSALTWRRDHFIARLLFDMKDRIGRDRITDFSNPGDRMSDFDEEPDIPIDDRSDEGLHTDRWGRVSMRLPQGTLSSSWMRLYQFPVYLRTELNLYNNLDKGLNTVSREDDSFVRGAQWYNALMWRWRLTRSVTWTHRAGGGVGHASRAKNDYDFFDESDFDPVQGDDSLIFVPFGGPSGGLRWVDEETFLVGEETFNYGEDVMDEYVWGDYQSHLQARLTDALIASLDYNYRKTTENHIGDWYARIGSRHTLGDLFYYPIRENNMIANLRYKLERPRLNANTWAYHNFIQNEELYPYEKLAEYGASSNWQNQAQTVTLAGGVSYTKTQMYHPTDSRSFIDSTLQYTLSGSYRPANRLWWSSLGFTYDEVHDEPLGDVAQSRYTETEDKMRVQGRLGGHLGPKYVMEVSAIYRNSYQTLSELSVSIQRDLHDAMLSLRILMEQDPYNTEYDSGEQRDVFSFMDEIDIQMGIAPKLPGNRGTVPGIPSITIIKEGDDGDDEGEDSSVGGVGLN
ncbi:MAG: hypothetical protein ACLFQ6_05315 [Candidatus Sumerlaeia bacterium]